MERNGNRVCSLTLSQVIVMKNAMTNLHLQVFLEERSSVVRNKKSLVNATLISCKGFANAHVISAAHATILHLQEAGTLVHSKDCLGNATVTGWSVIVSVNVEDVLLFLNNRNLTEAQPSLPLYL